MHAEGSGKGASLRPDEVLRDGIIFSAGKNSNC